MYILRGYTPRGTFGEWYTDDDSFICYSVERPWRHNAPRISCVPEGTYQLREFNSPKFGDTYALINHNHGVGLIDGEANRSYILIHAANTPSQLEGCIAPGLGLTTIGHEWAVSYSRDALEQVMKVAEKERILTLKSKQASWFAWDADPK